ncbi:hypothetical protein MPSEU_000837200 [Mayamaea pseudoterrestris]|nr:hypothetical protein MPSEU_000837200 [Mayamaea pseudoterrestris]
MNLLILRGGNCQKRQDHLGPRKSGKLKSLLMRKLQTLHEINHDHLSHLRVKALPCPRKVIVISVRYFYQILLELYSYAADAVHVKRQKVVISADKNATPRSSPIDSKLSASSLAEGGDDIAPIEMAEKLIGKETAMKETSRHATTPQDLEPMNTFPGRLMNLLDQGVASDAMWWLEQGDGFCVVPKLFGEKVLDEYFQGTKFESFTRKLNRWGFKRAAGQHVPKNTVAYYHGMFQKGRRDLLCHLRGGAKEKDIYGEQDIGCLPGTMPHQPPEGGGATSLCDSVGGFFPISSSESTALDSTSSGYPVSNLTSQFLPQMLPSPPGLHIQQLLAQRGGPTSHMRQEEQAASFSQMQAHILAAENAELRRLLLVGSMNQHQQSQHPQLRDSVAHQMGMLAWQRQLHPQQGPNALRPSPMPGNYTPQQQQIDPTLLQFLLEQQRRREGQN